MKSKRVKKKRASSSSVISIRKKSAVAWAKRALAYYEEKEGAAFEFVEAFYSSCKGLINPKSKFYEEWRHVSFTAKPKNADCNDVSPKHFFAEFLKIDWSSNFEATNCYTFEPSDYPGFDHGCIFCPPLLKYHPAVGYTAGRPPWYITRREWC